MAKRPDMLLWLSDARGIYIPRDFANSFADRARDVASVSDEQWAILEDGPDNEFYWDVWDEVINSAIVTDNNGVKFHVHQNGDCWLVPVEMEWNDEIDGYDYADERENVDD